MSPTLRAFRLGEPTPVSLRVLTLSCRTKLPGSSFLLIPSAPRSAEAVLGSLRTRRLRTTHGLGVCLVDARAPSIGLIPALRQGGRNAERIVRRLRPCALFAPHRQARLVRALGLPPRCYHAVHPRRLRSASLREKTPLTESLQPTDFQVHPRGHRIFGGRFSPPVIDPPSRVLAGG